MTDLPELPQTAQTHIQSMIEMARGEVQSARICINNAAEISGSARDQHLEDARATVRRATNLLFNAYAQEHLQANRSVILSLLPAICRTVELDISCPGFEAVVSETAREQKGKWTYRMSIEAAASKPGLWRDLSNEFALLAKEEREIQGIGDRLRLFATGAYKPGDGDIGYWWLTNGPRDSFRARYDAAATRAGMALVSSREAKPRNYRDYWLHCLSLYLSTNDSPHLKEGEDREHNRHCMLHNLPEASETFGSRLKECARENKQREKAISTAAAPKTETGERLKPSEEGAENPQKVGGSTSLNSRGQGRKRGPKPDPEGAANVADIVARVAPDGDWRSKLDELGAALDHGVCDASAPENCDASEHEKIRLPRGWRGKGKDWLDPPDRATMVKAIEYRLGTARKPPTETPS
jgi:hypothetical protein